MIRDLVANNGEHNPHHKLTNEQVWAMRADRAAGVTYGALAAEYGVSRSNAHQICTRRTWSHLPVDPPAPPDDRDRGGRRSGEPGNQGETNGQSKLTEAQVWAIRAQREAGATYAAIAARFDVSYSTVWNACNGQAWWHLHTPPTPAARLSRSASPASPPRPPVQSQRLYWHYQPYPAKVWTVVHYLGVLPQVLVIDSTRRLVYPEAIDHLDLDALVVRLSAPVGGEVQCRWKGIQ